jgi:hypothetical protein
MVPGIELGAVIVVEGRPVPEKAIPYPQLERAQHALGLGDVDNTLAAHARLLRTLTDARFDERVAVEDEQLPHHPLQPAQPVIAHQVTVTGPHPMQPHGSTPSRYGHRVGRGTIKVSSSGKGLAIGDWRNLDHGRARLTSFAASLLQDRC